MSELILKKFEKEDIEKIKRKNLYLVSFFSSYIEELYERYGYDGEIAGVFDLDEDKHGEIEAGGHRFSVYGYEEIKNCPSDSVLMITTGYFEDEFHRLESVGLPETVDKTVYFFANKDTEYYLSYHEKYKDQPLRDIIVFRSSTGTWEYVPGMDYTDNAKALFEYILREHYNEKYTLVWLVKEPKNYRDIEEQYDNVSFISFDWAVSDEEMLREKYYESICLAKFFFFTQASGFCRLKRDGQIRVQLWHGCGPKAEHYPVRQENHYEYMTVTSQYYADFSRDDFGLRDDQMLITGLAKEDWVFHPVKDWRERFAIPAGSKYVFWLPTFRNTFDEVARYNTNIQGGIEELQLFDNEELLSDMDLFLHEKNVVLIVKKHPLQKTTRQSKRAFKNIVFLENKQLDENRLHVNQILGNADALISDYSSVVVDYLLLNRPIGFVLSDKEQFEGSRGLYNDDLQSHFPGEKIYTIEDMKRFITMISEGIDQTQELREKSIEVSHKYMDDHNSERILKELGI